MGPFAVAASEEGFIATRAASAVGFGAFFGERATSFEGLRASLPASLEGFTALEYFGDRAASFEGLRTSIPASREGFFGTGPAPTGGLSG